MATAATTDAHPPAPGRPRGRPQAPPPRAARLAGAVRRRAGYWFAIAGLLRCLNPLVVVGVLVFNLVLGLLPIAFVLAMSELVQRVPAAVDAGPGAWHSLLTVMGLAAAAFALQQGATPLQAVVGEAVARGVDRYWRGVLMRTAVDEAPAAALEDQSLLDRLVGAREAFDRTVASPGDAAAGLVALVARYTQWLAAVVLIGYALSPAGAALIGATALVIRFGQRGCLGVFADFYDGLAPHKRRADYVKALGSGAEAAKEIRVFALLGWIRARYEEHAAGYLTLMWRGRRRLLGRPFVLLSVVALLGAAAVLALQASDEHAASNLLRLGIVLQCVLILMRFGVYFPECDVQIQYGSIAYRALTRFRDEARVLPAVAPGTRTPPGPLPRDAIRFEGVGFGYCGGAAVLDGLDLELPAGTSTAIVGLNGAGKSTLVKLLAKLYDPLAGSIRVDGVDLIEIESRHWHRRLAVIFQDFIRYELSAAENIALGAPEADRTAQSLLDAALRAGAGAVIERLPEGLETVLSRQYEGGLDLSGGQWQRVALARALHAVDAGASVLILDEPTAQLDVRAEVEFFDRFLDITRGLTTVIISHRFSTVRRADQIVVLDGGRVVEHGDHESLMAAGGQYAELFRLQAERFESAAGPRDAHGPVPAGDDRPLDAVTSTLEAAS